MNYDFSAVLIGFGYATFAVMPEAASWMDP
jgi:hypothetical protein